MNTIDIHISFVLNMNEYIRNLQIFCNAHSKFKYHRFIIILFAAFSGNIQFLNRTKEENIIRINEQIKLCKHICEMAIKGDQLHILKWLFENGYNWNDDIIGDIYHSAIAYGKLDILIWVYEITKNHFDINDYDICNDAAIMGQLEVIKWAYMNEYLWDSWTCAFAARNGHLEVLKWVRNNGCPWDTWTCTFAIEGGHLEILQWAIENDCPCDIKVFKNNIIKKRQYVIDNLLFDENDENISCINVEYNKVMQYLDKIDENKKNVM